MISFFSAAESHPDDQAFLTALYLEFERLMFSTARKYVSDWTDQQDVVQIGTEKLIKKASLLRTLPRCVLAGYIVSTIRNAAINYLKERGELQKRVTSMDEDTFAEPEAHTLPLDDLLISAERLSDLWLGLSDEERVLLEGKYILGFTDADLAVQLKCNPDSIRMKLTRARRKALARVTKKEEV